MGILWAHTGAIGCIGLTSNCRTQDNDRCKSAQRSNQQCIAAHNGIPYKLKCSWWINFCTFHELVCIRENKNDETVSATVWERGTLRICEQLKPRKFCRARNFTISRNKIPTTHFNVYGSVKLPSPLWLIRKMVLHKSTSTYMSHSEGAKGYYSLPS